LSAYETAAILKQVLKTLKLEEVKAVHSLPESFLGEEESIAAKSSVERILARRR